MQTYDGRIGERGLGWHLGSPGRFLAAIATLAAALFASSASGQSAAYPSRPITLLVSYTPGSTPDVIARIVAPVLASNLGQPVIVENKAGAGGTIGLAGVARARNDGHTLGLVNPAIIATAPAMYRNLPYDPVKDFSAVIKLATAPIVLLVPANSPAKTTQELLRLMKEKKKVLYSSGGVGTAQHLQGALLARMAGATGDHVPYRGQSQQLLGLVAGEADYTFSSLPGAIGFVKDGRLRALGVTTPSPSPSLPDVPSLSTAGLKGYDKSTAWFGVVVPAGTPEAVVDTLHRAFVKAIMNDEVRSKLAGVGFDTPPPTSADEFGQFIREQIPFWGNLVKISGATVD